MVMSVLERSHFDTVHHMARIMMHSNARAVFCNMFDDLRNQNTECHTKNSDFVLSMLQKTNALLQNTDFCWVELRVPGASPSAPNRVPGPNGMAACACTTKSGATFSFLCLLVDALPVRVAEGTFRLQCVTQRSGQK
jgi:hypothetical protein